MLFITNKLIKAAGDNLVFEKSNEISQSLKYCELVSENEFKEIESKPFMRSLMDADEKEILFYIHGFNNQPEEVFRRAKKMQVQLIDANLSSIRVVPIIWPCDDDFGIIKDYWDDQDSAEETGRIFSRSISKLMAWQKENNSNPCRKRMHVFAHSMGARVLLQCLDHWAKYQGGGGVPYLFKNIFLMAADIPNESLERGESGFHISQSAQRVICYFANDDLAMPASKVANVKNMVFSRRLGHTGPEDLSKVDKKVHSVNCDSFNGKFDKLKGHAYFLDKRGKKNPAFQHVIKVLKSKKQKLGKRERIL
uniref:Esterase/lipase superfamily enzyme n=1 Tax=Candidatus Kentrum sp. LFY TaxID=2126342 RepID=A0A450V9H8_9GAMM|nr:MAG: Alpha/beta hydrolase of unknown function (DUF900) [Candidatus Kentron sp. LFY]